MTPDSDIDVLFVPRDGVHLGWALNDLSDQLAQVLGRPVDLVATRALHHRLRGTVLSEAKDVYAARAAAPRRDGGSVASGDRHRHGHTAEELSASLDAREALLWNLMVVGEATG